METTGKQVLTFNQVKEILLIKDTRTLLSYIEKGLIPRIAVDESVMIIDQELLAREMNVENFDEPFISHAESAKLLDVPEKSLNAKFCKKKGLTYYRLRNGLKQELLFRKSDIEKFLAPTIEGVPLNVQRLQLLTTQLEQVSFFHKVGERLLYMSEERLTIYQMYLSGEDFECIAKKADLTKERVRQILYKLIRRTSCSLEKIEAWGKAFHDAEYLGWDPKGFVAYVKRLESENFALRKQVEQCTCKNQEDEVQELSEEEHKRAEMLGKNIQDLDLSVRAYNCLRAARIETFGDLIQYTPRDLTRFRFFGRKSLIEIEELVASFGFSLAKD